MRLKLPKKTANKTGAWLKKCTIGVICAAILNFYFQVTMIDQSSIGGNNTEKDDIHDIFVNNNALNHVDENYIKDMKSDGGKGDDDDDDIHAINGEDNDGDDDDVKNGDDTNDDDDDDDISNNEEDHKSGDLVVSEFHTNSNISHASDLKKYDNTPHLQTLQCEKYGGPSADLAAEMVYWWKIPSDEKFVNVFQKMHLEEKEEKYLIFEPDSAGFNNIRMSLETILTLGISMGRTIVLPPEKRIYLMWDSSNKQKHQFTFRDFFHLEEVEMEHFHLRFISMKQYLERVAMKGLLKHKDTGNVIFPPMNRTDWNGVTDKVRNEMWEYVRSTSLMDETWKPMDSFSYFTANTTDLGPKSRENIQNLVNNVTKLDRAKYLGKAFPVDAPMFDRLKEHLIGRTKICFYDEKMQEAKSVHFKHDWQTGDRFLLPFYGFHFFEDWKQDLWTKRFVRDHLHYSNEVFCVAARVVAELRRRAKEQDPIGNDDGRFHTMHIRRGDFHQQYKGSIMTAEEMVNSSESILDSHVSKTVFIASDEKDSNYFTPFKDKYEVYFLSNFTHLLEGVNSNYYPLIDQLISSRGDVFFGTQYSTFTSYINRLRGYYSWRDKLSGYKEGKIESYYFNPPHLKMKHQKYFSIHQPLWAYAFPEVWYDIDKDVM
eukprot:CAMPEP_0203671216 /NCGR_PEP_ID=MMETSP0090-20130426/7061_1 /ASSEMBLY_ACC=CAM_ASM_001088 /TAXON_ID=426623 /ORGANISM="Chaetoceros affinis, Strain CCMP159" /LENGTH=653 /DNA_ID=CAMNT_0050536229 /DNA_START=74 /DNA_END=2035 /DNA_ORIENTATION=+